MFFKDITNFFAKSNRYKASKMGISLFKVFPNISIVLHFYKINKILYFYVDKHTIYGIINSGRETVEAREFTPQAEL